MYRFRTEHWRKKTTGTARRIEEYNIKKVSFKDIEWLHLDEGRDKYWILVSTLINLGLHKLRLIPWPAGEILTSQKVLHKDSYVFFYSHSKLTDN